MIRDVLWPDDVALWRKILLMALAVPATLTLVVLAFAFANAAFVYHVTCLVDGRPNRLGFMEFLKNLP